MTMSMLLSGSAESATVLSQWNGHNSQVRDPMNFRFWEVTDQDVLNNLLWNSLSSILELNYPASRF